MIRPSINRPLQLRFKREAKRTLTIGLPVMGAQLLQVAMMFVDTVMAGRYSAEDLAAVAVGSSLFMPVFVFFAGTLMALSPIIAQLFGARSYDLIGKNIRQAIWLSVLLSIPAMLLLRNASPIMDVMGIEANLVFIADGYLKAIVWGLPAAFFYSVLRYFCEALGDTKPPLVVALIGLGFNIFFNYALIYGKFGFPEMGAVGTGWASAIVFWAMFLSLIVFVWHKKNYAQFEIFSRIKLPEKKYIVDILKLGLPIGVSATMEVTMFAVTTLLMGTLGAEIVAGHQIVINIASITFMIAFGLGTAITVRVGHSIGSNSPRTAHFAGFTGIALCTLLMCFPAIAFITFPETLISIYTTDIAVRDIGVTLLLMAAIFQISDGLQVAGAGALRGLKDTKVPMYANMVAYWIIGIPLGYILGFPLGYGPIGLWIGLIAGLTVAAIFHNIRFWMLSKKMMLERDEK